MLFAFRRRLPCTRRTIAILEHLDHQILENLDHQIWNRSSSDQCHRPRVLDRHRYRGIPRSSEDPKKDDPQKHGPDTLEFDSFILSSHFLHMGGFCLETPSGLRLQLDARDLISAISTAAEGETLSPDWLSEFEKVEEVHINDHAMSNPLTKLIACSQALWLVTQVISRVFQHRAVTLLEVSTLAYAACALTAYAAWWKKLQNSTLPITIPCSEEAIPYRRTNPLYYNEVDFREIYWAGQDLVTHFRDDGHTLNGLWALCLAIFGAIHVASWNITLPSNVEQWLWRASALYCCTACMVLVLADYFSKMCERMA